MLKKIISKFFIFLWLALPVSVAIYYFVAAPKESSYSEEENRKYAGVPEFNVSNIISGSYGEDMEKYLLDRFPMRKYVITGINRVENLMSISTYEEYMLIAKGPDDPLDSDDYLGDVDDLINDMEEETTENSDEEVTLPEESGETDENLPGETEPPTELAENPPIEPKPDAIVEDYPEILGVYMQKDGYEMTMNRYSRQNVLAVTAVLNKYASLLPKDGKLMFTVVPQSIFANQFVNAKEKTAFYANWDDVVNAFGNDNVYAFDSAEILSKAIQNNEYVYFRTDMHWTPYGSYLVYKEMAQRAGQTVNEYAENYNLTIEEPFRGTYYRDNPAAYMNVEADRLDLLMPKFSLEWRRTTAKDEYVLIDFLNYNAKANDRYTVYLGGPAGPWTYAECDNGQKENCLVLTDSFGLGYIPLLTDNYKQVHYYDPRYFNQEAVGYTVAQMIEKYEIQDIYVVVGDLHSFDSSFIITSANKQLGE